MRRTPYRDGTDTSSVKQHTTTSLVERRKVTTEYELNKGLTSVLGRTRFGVTTPSGRSIGQQGKPVSVNILIGPISKVTTLSLELPPDTSDVPRAL